jgi:uroporphyrinogen-III synthase
MVRVAITTAADRSSRLADHARSHGLEPVLLPCIEVIPASDAVLRTARAFASRADWLVVTSPRAVAAVWPDGEMPPFPVAAVGRATAASVEEAGGRVGLVGEAGAGSLVARLAERTEGTFVFFPHATGASPATIAALEQAGAEVKALAVYETRPVAPGPDPVDAVAFGSPSAVQGWLLSRHLDGLVLGAIGETTARALAEVGRPPQVVPPRPDFEDLMAHLAGHLRQRSPV